MIDFAQDSQCPKYWDSLGCTLCQSEQYQEALTAFERAIELDRNYTKAWNNRGNALSAMKRFAEALSSYDRAVAIQPEYHQAWFNRGLLLAEMGAYGNALEAYDRAISIHADPCYLHARENIWIKKQLFASNIYNSRNNFAW